MAKTVGVVFALKDNCTPQINKIAEKLKISTKEAQKMRAEAIALGKQLNKGFVNACKIATTTVLGLASATVVTLNKTREYADRVDDISKKIGISKKGFQEWEYIIKQNGAEIDILQKGIKSLGSQVLGVTSGNKDAINNFRRLGISVRDNNGHLKTQEILFGEVIEKLQKMPNGFERTALASKMFGKAGIELQPLLEENAKSISALRKECNDLGLILDDKTIEAANTFSDNIYTIQRAIGVMAMGLGNDLIPVMNDCCQAIIQNMPKIRETVIPIMQGMANAIKFVINNIDALKPVVIGCVGAFALFKVVDVAIKLQALATTISTVIPLMSTCKAWTLGMATATKIATIAQAGFNVVMNANPVVLLCSGLAMAIMAISALELKFKIVTRAVEKFKRVAKGIGEQFSAQNQKVKERREKGSLHQYASGTSFSSGGLSLVGETGPELVNLPRGAKVLNAKDTSKALNKEITVNLNIAGNVIGNREFIQQVSNALGRQLQTALQC